MSNGEIIHSTDKNVGASRALSVGANEIGAEPGTRGAPYFAQRPCQPHGVTERALTTIDACLLHGADRCR